MSFRIDVRIFIDEEDEDAVRVFASLSELAVASGFLANHLEEQLIVLSLADGRGITHEQLRHMNEADFGSTIVKAAREAGLPKGDMLDVEMAAFAVQVLLGEKMRFNKLVRTLFAGDVFDEEEEEEKEN